MVFSLCYFLESSDVEVEQGEHGPVQLIYPSSCTVIQRSDQDPAFASKPVHSFIMAVGNPEGSRALQLLFVIINITTSK